VTFETYTPRPRQARVQPGMRLGAYEILLCVARGGMASVWAARQHGARGFSRLVALKTVLPELAAPDLDMMFLDEARVSARIHHPNVCEVFELIEHQGVLALSMEWVDGDTLNNIINARGKEPAIDPRVAAQIVANVASGLHAAHELRDERGTALQLVHRDVSPQNILISRNGHVKVTDFGVAKSLGGARESTAVGKIKGKLSYMSPEQAQGKLLDRRSDIFSLGVVLYAITVGVHPFRRPGESRHQQLSRLVMNRIKGPSWVVKGYPPELEAIVMRALERDPKERFASADEMARALQNWVLASGPLVTDQQIARLVLERSGPTILERSERIANLMCKPADDGASEPSPGATEEAVPAAADPTLVPTTSRLTQARATDRALGARATLRVVSSTLTAGALFLLASFIFTSPGNEPSAPLAGSLAEALPPSPPAAPPSIEALPAPPAALPAPLAPPLPSESPAPLPPSAPAAEDARAEPLAKASSPAPTLTRSEKRAKASKGGKLTRPSKARRTGTGARRRSPPRDDSTAIRSSR
jgi:eukaryotic-like serine/threonine-protein kinase